MWHKELNNLKDFILENNKYFSEGFADCWQDPIEGKIYRGFGEQTATVFPADNLGNYFYLRPAQKLNFKINSAYAVSETTKGYEINESIILVACVQKADNDILLKNILYTLNGFFGNKVAFQSAVYENNAVVIQELSKLSKQERITALSRVPSNTTFVSVTFGLFEGFIQQNLTCLKNPILCC